jgi:DNA oxidative demethylase
VYRPELVDADEERGLLAFLETVDFREIVMRGQTARRTVRHYGWDYEYETWKLVRTQPLPAELEPARAAAAALAGVRPDDLAQILVTRYPPGAGIGWHRDAPAFGLVAGVSLGSACRLRLQRGKGEERETLDVVLEPRSGYVLDGPARSVWQHSIPATQELRYSITFRTLRNPGRWDT